MPENSHNKGLVYNLLFEVLLWAAILGLIWANMQKLVKPRSTCTPILPVLPLWKPLLDYPCGSHYCWWFYLLRQPKRHHQGTGQSISEQSFFSKDHLVDTKNSQKNQAITLAAEMVSPAKCPMRSAMQLALSTCQLLQPNDIPVAFYKIKKGKRFYLTGNWAAEEDHSKDTSRYYPGQPQEVLHPFVAPSGKCLARRGWKVSQKHSEEAPLAGWFLQNVSEGCHHYSKSAPWCTAGCIVGGDESNWSFAWGCYCFAQHDGRNLQTGHARVWRQHGLKSLVRQMIIHIELFHITFYCNYYPASLPTLQMHLVKEPTSIGIAYRAPDNSECVSTPLAELPPLSRVGAMLIRFYQTANDSYRKYSLN